MKRKFIAVAAVIMAIFMFMAAGCNLVTKDSDKDMDQVVATVSVDEGITSEIKKREVVMAYLNYGYVYVQSYGYTQKKAIQTILDSLVNGKILYQTAMKSFDAGAEPFTGMVVNADKAKYTAERYLTDDDLTEALYDARKSINDLLDGYDESKNDDSKKDTLTETVRTVPTDAKNYEKELTVAEKKEENAKPFDVDSSKERRAAFIKVKNLLSNNGLLGDDYDGTIESTAYYKSVLASQYESKIIEKYESTLKKSYREAYSFDSLKKAYEKKLNEQKEWSNEEFVSALSSASKSSPVLYSGFGTYGYVYNLLLGASDEIKDELNDVKTRKDDKTEKSEEELWTEKKAILDKITVKDLRSTWILSGYDFDGEKFTGDYTFAKDAANSLPFKGTVDGYEKKDGDEGYTVKSVAATEYNLTDFFKMMEEYLYGSEQADAKDPADGKEIYKVVSSNATIAEYDAKINELLFAFSTDSGSLNTYKGYVIKPEVETGNEDYVETFGTAGRRLLGMGKSSYIAVASSFGYHVMFFSEVFTPDYTIANNLVDYLNYVANVSKTEEEWKAEFDKMVDEWDDYEDTDFYMYLLMNEISSTDVSNRLSAKEKEAYNDALYVSNSVTKYESRYSDLYGE